MKNILRVLILALLVASCEETEPVLFDPIGGQTFASFNLSTSNLPVLIDETGEVTIQLNSTTLSSVDRTVTIAVDEELSTANPENYSVPASAVIPADQHITTFVVSGVDNSVDVDIETIVLNITSIDGGGEITENPHTINIFQVCPVPEDFFVGDYALADQDAVVGPGNGTENFAAATVNISIPTDDDGEIIDSGIRTFTAGILPAFAGDREVSINLVCGRLVLQEVNPNLTCNGEDSYIFISAGSDNSSYDISFTDDQSFTVFYTEDPEGSCGGPFLSSFTLNKI